MADLITPATGDDAEEVVPDYSRLGFKDLRKLCTARGIPADGNVPALIEKLKAYDVQHGKTTDTTVPDVDDDDDPLGLDDADDADDETPDGAGEAASTPAPSGPTGVAEAPTVGAIATINIPDGGTVTSAAPAVIVRPDPAEATAPKLKRGQEDMNTRNGVASFGGGDGKPAQRVFRAEFTIGNRDITDDDHFRFIAETHGLAAQAGERSRGGTTIGRRVGFAHDADGRRTVVYEVHLKRD